MVAKINVGNSLYGALAYNGEKVNEGQGRLLLTHKIFDDGTGTFDIRRAAEDFTRYLPEQVRTAKPVVHISLNPHPDSPVKFGVRNFRHRLLRGLYPGIVERRVEAPELSGYPFDHFFHFPRVRYVAGESFRF